MHLRPRAARSATQLCKKILHRIFLAKHHMARFCCQLVQIDLRGISFVERFWLIDQSPPAPSSDQSQPVGGVQLLKTMPKLCQPPAQKQCSPCVRQAIGKKTMQAVELAAPRSVKAGFQRVMKGGNPLPCCNSLRSPFELCDAPCKGKTAYRL